ncbi:MAG: hypothetical protein CSA22_06020 [Deltaproteobacteria bacterium]|nr:MAG: hypothetical protein CSA22_06020 [Deltaproteobacteria bacterium]
MFDEDTDLCYYGYRYYASGMGRWIRKDPIHELGFQFIESHEAYALIKYN